MKAILGVALALALTGCATQSYTINGGAMADPDKEVMQNFFVAGIGQTQEMDAAEICGGADKIAKVESEMSFLNGLLGAISYGIYTPRQAKVYCIK